MSEVADVTASPKPPRSFSTGKPAAEFGPEDPRGGAAAEIREDISSRTASRDAAGVVAGAVVGPSLTARRLKLHAGRPAMLRDLIGRAGELLRAHDIGPPPGDRPKGGRDSAGGAGRGGRELTALPPDFAAPARFGSDDAGRGSSVAAFPEGESAVRANRL